MKEVLTQKQKAVIDLIITGKQDNQAVLEVYDCKDISSAYQIMFKLRKNEVFKKELKKQEELKQTIILNEGKKLVDILEQIFPKVERAKILVEIAKSSDIRSKLEALKEINKIGGEYPKEEQEQAQIGGLNIVMIKGNSAADKEVIKEVKEE